MGKRTCSFEDCESPHWGRGYCHVHYARLRRAGALKPIPRPTLQERFEAKFEVNEATGCWEWAATKNAHGYGTMGVKSRREKPTGSRSDRAHRISYRLYIGDIPEGMAVCHRCDNPGCVNPAHLFLGTQIDNINDMKEKGRADFTWWGRQTHCIHGHEFTPENTRVTERQRHCRACARERWRQRAGR